MYYTTKADLFNGAEGVVKSMLERLYEKAHAWGDRPLTGRDLSRMIDETMRETRQAVGDESPSPYDLSARPGRLGVPRSKLG